MAKKKVEDIHGKTADELTKDLHDLKKQQFNLRFQKAQGQLADTSLIRQARRQVARIKTAQTAAASANATQDTTATTAKPAKKAAKAKA